MVVRQDVAEGQFRLELECFRSNFCRWIRHLELVDQFCQVKVIVAAYNYAVLQVMRHSFSIEYRNNLVEVLTASSGSCEAQYWQVLACRFM